MKWYLVLEEVESFRQKRYKGILQKVLGKISKNRCLKEIELIMNLDCNVNVFRFDLVKRGYDISLILYL